MLLILLILLFCSLNHNPTAQLQLDNRSLFHVYEDAELQFVDIFILESIDFGSRLKSSAPYRFDSKLRINTNIVENSLSVVISSNKGTLSVFRDSLISGNIPASSTKSLTKFETGNGEGFIKLTGSATEIRSILETAKYKPPANAHGYATIDVDIYFIHANYSSEYIDPIVSSVKGVYNSSSFNLRSSTNVMVQIIPQNDAPVIHIHQAERGLLFDKGIIDEVGYVTVMEDNPFSIGRFFSISDIDMEIQFNASILW